MRKTDISKYTDENGASGSVSASSIAKRTFSVIGKILLTGLLVMLITGIVIGVSMIFYIIDISNEPLNIDLHKTKLNLTSFIYVQNDNDEWEEYQQLYSSENRVWVDYQDIPKIMIDAQVAIEDKRFWDHSGVDWYRTTGAVLSLVSGRAEYGGSTITQQLIKNITDDNEVSITRKLREIFRALKLEKEYTKDEIIEAYLNVVNFGSGCRGVQSAANLYFNKDIQDCSIAECAAIAGITQ
ncbi:MAG: transglycosylase domain-containing protein, partial [Acutalibacteraceae bacterium]